MTQDENLELSHQHPASTNNFIDSNSSSGSICSDQQLLQHNEHQLHQSDINDDLNKTTITHSNSVDNNCNSNCNCDDANNNNNNNINEIIKPIISDILNGISDSINTSTQNINVEENELPKINELQLNHITSIDVIQLNGTDQNLESVNSDSPTKSIDNNNCVDENETCNIEKYTELISENKPNNNIEDVKFTTVIKYENKFHDENEIKFSENVEIKNLDNITNSVIDDENINAVKDLVILSDSEVDNTVGILNDINLNKTNDISAELENNIQLNSEKLNEEKQNLNIVIDENRSELKNQGELIASEENLIKSDKKIVDEKQLTDNLNENNFLKKQLSNEKLNEDPIERLNKLRANITNALREVKGVLRQYSSNIDQNIDIINENKNHSQMAPVTDDSAVVQFRFVRKIRRRSQLSDDDINDVDIINNKINNNNNNNNNNNSELTINKQLDIIPEIRKTEKILQVKNNEENLKENIVEFSEKAFDKKDSETIVSDKKSDIILEIKPENIVENLKINVKENKEILKSNLVDKKIDVISGTTNENLERKPKTKLKKSISIDTDNSIDGSTEQKTTTKKKLKKQTSIDSEIKTSAGKNVEEKPKKKLTKAESVDKTINKVAKDKVLSETKSTKTKLKKQLSMDTESGTANNNKSLKLEETASSKNTLKKQATASTPESTNKVTEIKNENVPKISKIPVSVNKNDKIIASQKTELKSETPVKANITENQTDSKISNKSSEPIPATSKSPKTALLDEVVQLLKKPKEKTEILPKIPATITGEKSSSTLPAKIETQIGISSKIPKISPTEIEKKVVQQNEKKIVEKQQIKDTKESEKLVDVPKSIPKKSTEIVSKSSLLSEVEKLLNVLPAKTEEIPSTVIVAEKQKSDSNEVVKTSLKPAATEKPEVLPMKSTEAAKLQQTKPKEVAQLSPVTKSEPQNTTLQKNAVPPAVNVNDKNKLGTIPKPPVSQANKSITTLTNEITPKNADAVKTKKVVTNTSNAVSSPRQASSSANKSATNTMVNPKDIKQDIPESAKVPTVLKQMANSTSASASSAPATAKAINQPTDKKETAINSTSLDPIYKEIRTGTNSNLTGVAPKNNNPIENARDSQIVATEITQIGNKSNSSPIEIIDAPKEIPTSTESNHQTDCLKPQEIIETITDDSNTITELNSTASADAVEEEDVPLSPHVPKDDLAKKIATLAKEGHAYSANETETENEVAEDEDGEPDKVKERKKRKAIKKVVIRRVKRKLSVVEGFAQAPLPEAETEVCEKEIFKDNETEATTEAAEEELPKEKPKPKSCLKVRAYEPGDLVLYADRVKKTQVKWRLATVVERITGISYKLNIEGEEKTCHLSYIKKYTNKKITFGGKEYLEIDYAQIEADEEKERNYSIWNLV